MLKWKIVIPSEAIAESRNPIGLNKLISTEAEKSYKVVDEAI